MQLSSFDEISARQPANHPSRRKKTTPRGTVRCRLTGASETSNLGGISWPVDFTCTLPLPSDLNSRSCGNTYCREKAKDNEEKEKEIHGHVCICMSTHGCQVMTDEI